MVFLPSMYTLKIQFYIEAGNLDDGIGFYCDGLGLKVRQHGG